MTWDIYRVNAFYGITRVHSNLRAYALEMYLALITSAQAISRLVLLLR